MKRRTLLKSTLVFGATSIAATISTLTPKAVLADWSEAAFAAKSVNDAMLESMGSNSSTDSGAITLTVPDTPENAATVPVEVATTLPNVSAIAVLVDKNPRALCGIYRLGKLMKPEVTVRIKVAETSNIIAVVKSDGKLFTASKNVKVTIGGCA